MNGTKRINLYFHLELLYHVLVVAVLQKDNVLDLDVGPPVVSCPEHEVHALGQPLLFAAREDLESFSVLYARIPGYFFDQHEHILENIIACFRQSYRQ